MTLEEEKNQNNKNITNNKNDFSKEVFDILKKYETKPQERKRFSMKKSTTIKEADINANVKSALLKRQTFADPKDIEIIDGSIKHTIRQAKWMLSYYINNLWIKVNAIKILEELKVNFLNKDQERIAGTWWLGIVDIDFYKFLKENEDGQKNILIHEFSHHLSTVLTKYTYDINFWNLKKINDYCFIKNIEINNINHAIQSWYHTQIIGKSNHWYKYWEFFNEWMTDLITNKILSENWLELKYSYWYNIFLIDKMILYVAKTTRISYEILLDLLIKWYFHGDYKALQLFEKVLWKEFWEIFMWESSKNNEIENTESLESKWFFEKYPFMKIEDTWNLETLSDDLQLFLGIQKNSFWKPF